MIDDLRVVGNFLHFGPPAEVISPFRPACPRKTEGGMEDKEREALTEKSNALRVELKIWEKEFASASNGLKASRDDIKKNAEIGIFSSFPTSSRC